MKNLNLAGAIILSFKSAPLSAIIYVALTLIGGTIAPLKIIYRQRLIDRKIDAFNNGNPITTILPLIAVLVLLMAYNQL